MLMSFSLSNFLTWEKNPGVVGTAENLGLDKGMFKLREPHSSYEWAVGKTMTCQTR